MRYVLLLRGINVGGRNKIVMADLRQAVADLGYDNVETYINSGNLFFLLSSKYPFAESSFFNLSNSSNNFPKLCSF